MLFKRAKRDDDGFIQFVVSEVGEVGDLLSALRMEGEWRFEVEFNDNAVMFDTRQEAAFLAVKKELKSKLPSSQSDRITTEAPSIVEEPSVPRDRFRTVKLLVLRLFRSLALLTLSIRRLLRKDERGNHRQSGD
ncbi:MAG: hypothetical protein WC369_07685 [Dehalococcoidales bacterium]